MNNTQFGYPIKKIDCTKQGFPEIPDMLFGKTTEGVSYFDATALLKERDLGNTYIQMFLETYNPIAWKWLYEGLPMKGTPAVINENDGHICLHESLRFLFLSYIDRDFALHIHSQLEKLFTNGVAFSDAFVAQLAYSQLSQNALRLLIDGGAKEGEA